MVPKMHDSIDLTNESSPAEVLLEAGAMLYKAQKCGCENCQKFLSNTDTKFGITARIIKDLSQGSKANIVFDAMIERWDYSRILKEINERCDITDVIRY